MISRASPASALCGTGWCSVSEMSLFPHSHKTVFVLDHGPYFAMPCQTVEYDVGRRAGPGFIPLKPIKKLVWTSAVEAVAEYCRIVWDIFPRGDRLIRVVVGGSEAQVGWGEAEQNMSSMLDVVAGVGSPSCDTRDSGVVAGVRRGMELLCQLSPRQLGVSDGGLGLVNRGRIVVVTTLKSDAKYQQLVAAVEQQLALVNKEAAAAGDRGVQPLAELEVTVLHTQPSSAGDIGLRTEQDVVSSRQGSPFCSVLKPTLKG